MEIRVGIIDDHPTTVLGVESLLAAQDDMALVARGTTVAEFLEAATEVDVVLLDLTLADGSSPTENLRTLADAVPVPILAFTSGDSPRLIREASRHGAIGMIRKSVGAEVMAEAIRAAARGEVIASADWAAALELDTHLQARLTARESEVLALYAAGETAERVGEQLYISRQTVIDHIRRIRAKYAAADRPVDTRIKLYLRAVEDGIISPHGR